MKLPAFHLFEAPGSWAAIDFISDLHLGPHNPRTVAAWASYMRGSAADAIFMLGDLFEAWVGDDVRSDPFEAACLADLAAAAPTHFMAFMHGNRDFLVGPGLLGDVGAVLLPDPTVLVAFGRRTLLSHGDELCLDDVAYQRFRTLVRNPEWQRQVLAQPLEARKALARQVRDESEGRKAANLQPENWADLDKPATLTWMAAAGTPALVHGHTHKPDDEVLAPGYTRLVLSDWDVDVEPPGGARAEVLRLTSAGFRRLSIEAAVQPRAD